MTSAFVISSSGLVRLRQDVKQRKCVSFVSNFLAKPNSPMPKISSHTRRRIDCLAFANQNGDKTVPALRKPDATSGVLRHERFGLKRMSFFSKVVRFNTESSSASPSSNSTPTSETAGSTNMSRNELEEISPRAFIKLISIVWMLCSIAAIIYPLKMPAAMRMLKLAPENPEFVSLITGLIRFFLGGLSFLSAITFGGFTPSRNQANEANAAFISMALTQLPAFKTLTYPAIGLAAAQLLIGVYFSGVASKMNQDESPPDFLRDFLKAYQNATNAEGKLDQNLIASATNPKLNEPKPPLNPAETVAKGISLGFVVLTLIMIFAPLRFLRWTLTPTMLAAATSTPEIQAKMVELVRNVLSVIIIACGRVFAGVESNTLLLQGTARGLYVAGFTLFALSRGVFGNPQIFARLPGTLVAVFLIWNAVNFSAFSAQWGKKEAKEKEAKEADASNQIIDVEAKET